MTTAQGSNQDIVALREKTGAGILDCKKALTEAQGNLEKAVEILRKKGLADVAKRAGRTTGEGLVIVKISADGKTAGVAELKCETDFVAKTADFSKLANQLAEYVLANPSTDYANDAKVKDMISLVAPKFGENTHLGRADHIKLSGTGFIGQYIHTDNKKAAVVELSCDATTAGNKAALEKIARELALQIVAMMPRWTRREEVPADIIEKEKEIFSTQARNQGKPDAAIEKMLPGKVKKFYEDACLLDQPSIRDAKMSVEQYLKTLSGEAGGEVKVVRFFRYG